MHPHYDPAQYYSTTQDGVHPYTEYSIVVGDTDHCQYLSIVPRMSLLISETQFHTDLVARMLSARRDCFVGLNR